MIFEVFQVDVRQSGLNLEPKMQNEPTNQFSFASSDASLLRNSILAVFKDQGKLPGADLEAIRAAIDLGIQHAAEQILKVRTEREIKASDSAAYAEARYKEIFEGIKDHAIIRTDPDGNVIEWNPGAERILQFSKDEIFKKSASIIFTPEDLSRGIDELEMKTARETGCAEDNRWHVKKDGSRFYATGVMNPFFNSIGKLAGYIKVLRDNTSERLLQEDLVKHQAKLREVGDLAENSRKELYDLIMQAPIPLVALAGPEHRFIVVNPPYERLVGKKVAGKTLKEAFPNEEASLYKPLLDEVYESGVPFIGHEMPFHSKMKKAKPKPITWILAITR